MLAGVSEPCRIRAELDERDVSEIRDLRREVQALSETLDRLLEKADGEGAN